MTRNDLPTINSGGCNINTEKNLQVFRHVLASVLAASLFCSQVLGQTLSTADHIGTGSESTSIDTIRLAQADTGTSDSSWLGEIDIDPPVIDHEALESGKSGESQEFSALVVDDRGLKHVVLYYRDRAGAQYDSVELQPVDGSDEYTAVVETSLGQTRVEYYIEALDSGGNRVLKGFPFFPLVRELASETANVREATESSATESRLIYVLLGVAAVGLALALSGGDDSSSTNTELPAPGTVPLNIFVTPP